MKIRGAKGWFAGIFRPKASRTSIVDARYS
jgi:hypothetical protein